MKKVILLLLVAMAVCGCKNTPDASLNAEVQKLRQEVAELRQQVGNPDDDNTIKADDSAPMDDSTADGKYIGQYIGTFKDNGQQTYKGTFYNVKGTTVSFNLYEGD